MKPYLILCLMPLITLVTLGNEKIPFVLPWDDQSSNVTNLAWTLEAPAGASGHIGIDANGHYVLGDARMRFFGVNIGAGACFPPQEKAPAIAKRLARFGMNVVRFHHMDNGWSRSIIDYEQGSSKVLHEENLDRFDRLVAELKAVGIYSNINLLCSREFKPADGLHPSVAQMPWKETHLLGFFDEGARNLQKEFALKLLTHVNPYTGLSYAEDPAVAFVEIHNENGLIHQWHSEAIDRLPLHYEQMLRSRWNAWLQERHASTTDMLDAWGAIDIPPGSPLISNGNFESDSDGWNLENHQGAVARLNLGTFGGRRAAQVQIQEKGSAGWHVQLTHAGLEVQAEQIYTLRFWIRASTPRDVSISVMQAHDPWENLGYASTIAIHSEWQFVERSFVLKQGSNNARFNLGNLGSETGTVEIASVSFQVGGSFGGIPEGTSLESGSVPIFTKAKPGTPAGMRDWFQFMVDLETDYWTDMETFVRGIGYTGLTWGTTVMNSTPNVQGIFESIDSHSYWQHPQFLGQDWDPEQWIVQNVSMVNASDGGTLPDLAWQRVKGKPHNVSEYQHSSPNHYGAEGPLFIAAYGSLQDWDGIYLFHYGADADDWDRGYFSGFFDMDQHPAKLINASVASLIFRRMDVQPAHQVVSYPFSIETEMDIVLNRGAAWSVGDGRHLDLPRTLPLKHRFELILDPDLPAEDSASAPVRIEIPNIEDVSVVVSDTGELTWDRSMETKGAVRLDTPKVRAVWGFQAARTWEFDGLRLRVENAMLDWGSVVMVFTEGEGFGKLASGGRGLVIATGSIENTNMGWKDPTKTSVGTQWGQAPVQVEMLPVEMQLGIEANRLRVWSLDARGDRKAELPVRSIQDGATFMLGGSMGSLWYEFEIR